MAITVKLALFKLKYIRTTYFSYSYFLIFHSLRGSIRLRGFKSAKRGSNGNYTLKSSIENTKANVLIIVGEKELGIMKKSAGILKSKLPDSVLYISKQMGHGELSLVHPKEYVEVIKKFLCSTV